MRAERSSWTAVWGVIAISIFSAGQMAVAGTTGKLTGRVSDEKGMPLPGASVVIEGARQGAITDADGFYVILSIGPGTYSLSASLIGYAKTTKRDVRVSVDYTTTVDFKLKEEAVAAAEVVVTAERPPVELDKTSSKYVTSADDIKQIPIIKTTGEFISLQPGVDMGGTFSIRGGDISDGRNPTLQSSGYVGNDANVMIDGIRVSNKDGHSAILFTGVNRSVVQQLSVETGVTSAEYGDAQAGTINIVTQDGRKDFHGWMEFGYEPPGRKHWGANVYDSPIHRDHMKWNDPAWANETDPVTGRRIHVREDYTGVSGYRMEGSLSGPVGSRASFLASLKHEGRAATLPSATSRGFYDDRGQFITAPRNIQGSASLTVKPTEGIKVKAGLILQRYTAWNNETTERVSGLARGLDEDGRNIFLPKDWGAAGRYRFREELEYLTFTHALSPRTFYEVRVAHGRTKQDTVGVPFVTQNPRRDKDGWFNIERQTGAWVLSDRRRWIASFTRFLVASLIGLLRLSTYETVLTETPASRATSLISAIHSSYFEK